MTDTSKMHPGRRRFLELIGGLGLAAVTGQVRGTRPGLLRPIPSSGERIPAIGMGTWLTFDVGEDLNDRKSRLKVLQAFFAMGGRLIDSSPMYDSSEEVIGWCLQRAAQRNQVFAATKVWTVGRANGVNEMEHSRKLWGIKRFDLMQVHNLLDWDTHLETLRDMKQKGRIRYLGVTTSHGRRHAELEHLLRTEPLDFVQLTYNVEDREAETRLLPLAAERKVAVIVNRPFQGGSLFRRVRGRPLPTWASEFDCANWAQFFLKFIVSHPAVTCAIPATTRVDHMKENMGAMIGRLPDPAMRRRMIRYYEEL